MIVTEIVLKDYIKKPHVFFIDAKSRDEAIRELISGLTSCGTCLDGEAFYQATMQRESIVSTGIGVGIAIPHAKYDGCTDFFIAVGIHKGPGIPWDAIDGLDVKLIFLIGGPKHLHKEYLVLLSQLTKTIKDEKTRQKLIRSNSAEEVMHALNGD
jgi:nitrogen PTS system EIIA component